MNLFVAEGKIFRNVAKFGKDEAPVARITLMINSEFKKDENFFSIADFIDFVSFSPLSNTILSNFKKDDEVCIEAMVRNRSYVNKKNEKVYTNDFIIQKITLKS